jgi:hypothetical protein
VAECTRRLLHNREPRKPADAVDIVRAQARELGSVLCMRKSFVVVAVATLLLGGCVGPEPQITPTETVSEPVFASEEEALAAAEEVFAAYLAATDQMGRSGGTDLSAFDGVVTERLLDEEESSAQTLQEKGWHLEGSYGYRDLKLQQLDQSSPPAVFLQAYVCLDLTNVAYYDSAGIDQSVDGHSEFSPVEVVFQNEPSAPSTLVVDRADRWTGNDFCA